MVLKLAWSGFDDSDADHQNGQNKTRANIMT